MSILGMILGVVILPIYSMQEQKSLNFEAKGNYEVVLANGEKLTFSRRLLEQSQVLEALLVGCNSSEIEPIQITQYIAVLNSDDHDVLRIIADHAHEAHKALKAEILLWSNERLIAGLKVALYLDIKLLFDAIKYRVQEEFALGRIHADRITQFSTCVQRELTGLAINRNKVLMSFLTNLTEFGARDSVIQSIDFVSGTTAEAFSIAFTQRYPPVHAPGYLYEELRGLSIGTFPVGDWPKLVTYSPDNNTCVVISDSGLIEVTIKKLHADGSRVHIKWLNGNDVFPNSVVYPIDSVSWLSDNQHIVVACRSHPVGIFNVETGRAHFLAQDSKINLGDSGTANAHLVDFRENQMIAVVSVFCPNGSSKNLVGIFMHVVRLVDTTTGKWRDLFRSFPQITAIKWSKDCKQIAFAVHKTIYILDRASGNVLYELHGHNDAINTIAWSPDGEMIASASRDKVCLKWNVPVFGSLALSVNQMNWLQTILMSKILLPLRKKEVVLYTTLPHRWKALLATKIKRGIFQEPPISWLNGVVNFLLAFKLKISP